MRKAVFVAFLLMLGSAVLGATAGAGGVSPSTLMNAGWTCFNDPGAPRIVCSDPAMVGR